MTDILEPINSALAGFVDSSGVQLTSRLVFAYIVILWVATAWWAFKDVSRRTTSLPAPFLVAGLLVLATPLFFLPAAVVYRVIRPGETLAEATERDLTETALEATADQLSCPSCANPIEADWRLCPYCRYELLVPCPNCAQPVDSAWSICPWCVKELPWAREPVGVFEQPTPAGSDERFSWPDWGDGVEATAASGPTPAEDPPLVWPADWEVRVARATASAADGDSGTAAHATTSVAVADPADADPPSEDDPSRPSRPATRL